MQQSRISDSVTAAASPLIPLNFQEGGNRIKLVILFFPITIPHLNRREGIPQKLLEFSICSFTL